MRLHVGIPRARRLTELFSLLRLRALRIRDHEIVTRLAFLLFRLFLIRFIVGPLKSKGLFWDCQKDGEE